MAKQRGKIVKVMVGNGGDPTETFNVIKGEVSCRLQLTRDSLDTSDKSTDDWATSITGLKNASVTCSGKLDWPDANGLARIKSAWDNGTEVNCQVIIASDDSMYEGAWTVSSFEISGEANGVAEFSFTLAPAAALTYTAGA